MLKERFFKLVKLFNFIGAYICLLIMFITVADIVGRYFFGKNILGIYEMTKMGMVLVVFLGTAYTEKIRAHVSVEIFVTRAPKVIQGIISVFISSVGLVFFSVMTWANITRAFHIIKSGQTTQELLIPIFPFIFVTVISYAFLCIAIFFNFAESFISLISNESI